MTGRHGSASRFARSIVAAAVAYIAIVAFAGAFAKRLFVHDSETIVITPGTAPPEGRVTTARAPFRYVFAEPEQMGSLDEPRATVENGYALVGRNGELVSFDLLKRKEVRLAPVVPNRGAFFSGESVVYGYGRTSDVGAVVGIDRATGTERWRRGGYLLGADSRHAFVLAPSGDPRERDSPFSGRLVDLDPATGARRWVVPNVGCAPQRPAHILADWVILAWDSNCGVSANGPRLMFLRLRDGAQHDVYDATEFLALRGNDVFLAGDDNHYGEYGPANLGIYDAKTSALVRKRIFAPDRPESVVDALGVTADASALADSYWVSFTSAQNAYAAALYRYDLKHPREPPGRVDSRFGRWFGIAIGNETYFACGDRLVALVERSATSARAEPFAGRLRDPHEAIVDGRFVYVREWGGRIGVFERSTRRNVRIVEADCAGLRSIVSAGTQHYALCVEPDHDRAVTREALIAL